MVLLSLAIFPDPKLRLLPVRAPAIVDLREELTGPLEITYPSRSTLRRDRVVVYADYMEPAVQVPVPWRPTHRRARSSGSMFILGSDEEEESSEME